jgi:hypothetical protein
MVTFFIIYVFFIEGIHAGLMVFMAVWFALFYLIGQYRYASYAVYSNRIRKHFIVSFYLKDREYFFSNVKLFFFYLHTKPGGGDEFVTLHFKNGKTKRLFIPKNEILDLRSALEELQLPVQSSRYKWDKPTFDHTAST